MTPVKENPLPAGWRWVKLGNICLLNPRRPEINRSDDALTTFVQMSAVNEEGKGIRLAEKRPFIEVRKGYTYFEEGDLLFAKITPCMQNGKHAVAYDLIDGFGFGSTEFHVIRSNAEILAEWIHAFLIQPYILQDATGHFTGAVGQQRVPELYLASLEIPLPPLSEQKRIAVILTEQLAAVDRARAAAEAQLQAAKQLPAAFLSAVFDSDEAKHWPKRCLGDVALIVQNGIYKPAEFYGSGSPFIRMYNIQNTSWRLALDRIAQVEVSDVEKASFGLDVGDLLVSRVNSFELVGKCAWIGSEAKGYMFENMLIRIKLNQTVDSLFVAQQMNIPFIRKQIQHVAKRAIGQSSINSTDVRGISIKMPSLEMQQSISCAIDIQMRQTSLAQEYLQTQLDTINQLPATLLRQAFSGEI